MNHQLPEIAAIRWQCRRGMLELDMMLLPFFDQHYVHLNSEQQQDFCDLLAFPDQELYQWLIGRLEPSSVRLQVLLKDIRQSTWKE
jgi:antitoxin CptB